jgi:hypothetical protein
MVDPRLVPLINFCAEMRRLFDTRFGGGPMEGQPGPTCPDWIVKSYDWQTSPVNRYVPYLELLLMLVLLVLLVNLFAGWWEKGKHRKGTQHEPACN